MQSVPVPVPPVPASIIAAVRASAAIASASSGALPSAAGTPSRAGHRAGSRHECRFVPDAHRVSQTHRHDARRAHTAVLGRGFDLTVWLATGDESDGSGERVRIKFGLQEGARIREFRILFLLQKYQATAGAIRRPPFTMAQLTHIWGSAKRTIIHGPRNSTEFTWEARTSSQRLRSPS